MFSMVLLAMTWAAQMGSGTNGAQAVAIQNATVETRRSIVLADDIARASAGADPVWVAWSVPMIPGERQMCSVWSSQTYAVRGLYLEGWTGDAPPAIAASAGPLRLEAGTHLVMFARVVDGRVERLRVASDDCPVDAGGRHVIELTGVSPDASVRYLETLIGSGTEIDRANRSLLSSVFSAVALHATPAADEVLERMAGNDKASDVRRQAASWLARSRGTRGLETLARLLASATTDEACVAYVGAMGQAAGAAAFDMLSALARTHANARVRVEAVRAITSSSDPRAKPFLESLLR